jgi:AcrR family transcriptional regulator
MSATENRRERKMQETAARLTSVSRRLTAERGLSGFTIEEVCDEVDVSRRTFFNYFPSKEDAILGAHPEEESQRFTNDYLARGSRGWNVVIDDMVDLIVEHFSSAGVDSTVHAEFMAAVDREPRLLLRFIGATRDRDRQVTAIVAQREGVALDDPRAEASVNVLSTLIRTAGEKFLDPAHPQEFEPALRDSLAAMRLVLATTTPRKATP